MAAKIVLIASKTSNNGGKHEFPAGCELVATLLNKHVDGVEAVSYREWPDEAGALDGAAAVFVYSEGGPRHPAIPRMEQLKALAKQGMGFTMMHYAVEVPKGEPGDFFLNLIGGYFETHWSVNPRWTAEFTSLPDHPVTRGVEPFSLQDEWYFHMRFRPQGVTPVLSAIAPASTMAREDGPHSGNPDARKAVANGDPQHLAWCIERDDGGRSFGFTGGCHHDKWAVDDARKLLLNAIVWTAKVEVPEGGVSTPTPTEEELESYLD